jgi:hypothetical protein
LAIEEEGMIQNSGRALVAHILAALFVGLAGCGGLGQPEEGPEAVAKRFYDLIAASKVEGGTTPASEAFKLTNGPAANLNLNQFLEIIKNYPPGFQAKVGTAEIKGKQALVAISFKMPSSFGGEYEVKQELPLNLDPATHTWKIDFTGDTHGMQKDDAISASQAAVAPKKD